MNSIQNRYNRFLILIFSVAPIVAFITVKFLGMDFNRIMQLFLYIGVFLLLIFRNNRNPIKFPKYLFFYFLFVVYVFYTDLYRLQRDFKVGYLFSNPLIGGLLVLFIIENVKIEKIFFRHVIFISKIVLILAVFVIIIQQITTPYFFANTNLTGINEIPDESDNENRLLSIYSWIGGYLNIGFGFIPVFILIIEDLDHKKKRVLFWLLMGLLFVLLSKARWIMVNYFLVFATLFINHKDKIRQFFKYIILLPLLVFLSFLFLNAIGINAIGIVKDRVLESDKNLNQKSAGSRILAFKAFDRLYWNNPIFGVGNYKYGMAGSGKHNYELRSFLAGRSAQIHVGYLALFYTYGLVGGILFLSFLYLLLKKLFKEAKYTGMWGPFLGILGLAVANLTLVTYSIYFMGFVIVLAANKFYIQKFNPKNNQIA